MIHIRRYVSQPKGWTDNEIGVRGPRMSSTNIRYHIKLVLTEYLYLMGMNLTFLTNLFNIARLILSLYVFLLIQHIFFNLSMWDYFRL
jgi:hypothetical protein